MRQALATKLRPLLRLGSRQSPRDCSRKPTKSRPITDIESSPYTLARHSSAWRAPDCRRTRAKRLSYASVRWTRRRMARLIVRVIPKQAALADHLSDFGRHHVLPGGVTGLDA